MKLFQILFLMMVSTTTSAEGQHRSVPNVGSVWESTTVYLAEDGSPPRQKNEVAKVERLLDGRPVFVGKILGLEGEIVEGASGTIVYAEECKKEVPKEKLIPPILPNQCVWHVCYAPPVGTTFTRPMTIYVPLFGCQPQLASYTFTSVRQALHVTEKITVGKAQVTFNGVPRSSWESHIKEGEGEVFAERLNSVTTYNKVAVPQILYWQRAHDNKN